MTFSRALQKGRNANVGMMCRVAQSEEIRHKLLCKENEADTNALAIADPPENYLMVTHWTRLL